MHVQASPIVASALLSCLGFVLSFRLIPAFRRMFVDAGLFGMDLSKINTTKKVPEAMGMISAAVYLVCMFLFIPFPFWVHNDEEGTFPHHKFAEFIVALLSICCMVFLGFADDVLNLRWRHKLFMPTIAALPLLMVYSVNIGSTSVSVPMFAREWVGTVVDLGPLFYVYMGMLSVFCTNSINILAGVNGIEVGQSLVIALSILFHNIIQLDGCCRDNHLLSIYFLLPLIATCLPLAYYNWFPARVFVGDTFCYFAGMTFAVVGILGHFPKTMILFFIPQVFNFVLSVPQLFHFIPCPRHRMPRFNRTTRKLECSTVIFVPSELSLLGRVSYRVLRVSGLVTLRSVSEGDNGSSPSSKQADSGKIEMSNLTIINVMLKFLGPTREPWLATYILLLQGLFSALAFFIRYVLVYLVYEENH